MRKILITGMNSYVGKSLENWLSRWISSYEITKISLRDGEWRNVDFSKYDVLIHLAGIAHVSTDPRLENEYYKVNRDLSIEVAKKAKNERVKQFLFASSIIIYGEDKRLSAENRITETTVPMPTDFYGRSKLEADIAIQKLNDQNFKVVILRLPMVYGPDCKGNFPKLVKLARRIPIFPDVDNCKSMIYVGNLCQFIKVIIDTERQGVFFPQNDSYTSSTLLMKTIASNYGRKILFLKWTNVFLNLLSRKLPLIIKVFGNKYYDKSTLPDFEYCLVGFEESIGESMGVLEQKK